MTTKIIKTMMLTAALTIAWGCSSDNNDENVPTENVPTENPSTFAQAEKPTWSVDFTGSDPQPQWTDPDQSLYTTSTTILAKLEDELAAHYTADDQVAVFAGSECRGTGRVGMPFTVFCTSAEESLQLRYYSAQQGGIYTLTQPVTINKNETKTVTINF